MIFVSISLKYDEDNVIVEMGISVNDPFEENIDYWFSVHRQVNTETLDIEDV